MNLKNILIIVFALALVGGIIAAKKSKTVSSLSEVVASDPKCLTESSPLACYEKFYADLVAKAGVEKAFADLRTRYESDSFVRSQCHPLTHVLGNSAVKLYPQVSSAFSHGDAFCWSGYYHGVMEGIVGNVGEEKILAELNNICADIPGKAVYSFDYYNCVHGLGHGLMALKNIELFESLETCNTLVGGWEKSSCYSGVFMENVIVDNKNHFTKYLKPSEPLYPCNAVADQYKTSCYLMQTSYMLKVSGNDFAKVFSLCRKSDKGYENLCFQSLGRDASGQSVSNAEQTKATCDLGASYDEKSNCVVGAVKDFISYYHSDIEAKNFCSILSEDLGKVCLDTAVAYYRSF